MTTGAEPTPIYEALRQHYAANGCYIPNRKEVLDILKLRVTPQEAEVVLQVPVLGWGRTTPSQVAQKMGRDEVSVAAIMDGLARKGVIIAEPARQGGGDVYALFDFNYQLYTPAFGDGIDNDERRRLTSLREKYWEQGYAYARYPSRYPNNRVFPHESGLAPGEELAPWERASHYVEQATIIATVACGCRASLKKCQSRLYSCIHFNNDAAYWIKYRGGRPLRKEECLKLLEEAGKEGLVISGPNSQEAPRVFCTCCPDCCVILRPYIENHNPHAITQSNFRPFFDKEKCKVCGLCTKACPVGAIGKYYGREGENPKGENVVVAERCLGCGVCTFACPRGAVTLKRVRQAVPAATHREANALHVANRDW